MKHAVIVTSFVLENPKRFQEFSFHCLLPECTVHLFTRHAVALRDPILPMSLDDFVVWEISRLNGSKCFSGGNLAG